MHRRDSSFNKKRNKEMNPITEEKELTEEQKLLILTLQKEAEEELHLTVEQLSDRVDALIDMAIQVELMKPHNKFAKILARASAAYVMAMNHKIMKEGEENKNEPCRTSKEGFN